MIAEKKSVIVVASGANAALSPDQIRDQAYQNAEICLLQLEIPLETVVHAASLSDQKRDPRHTQSSTRSRPASRNLASTCFSLRPIKPKPNFSQASLPTASKISQKQPKNSSKKVLKMPSSPWAHRARFWRHPIKPCTYRLLRPHQ